MLLPPVLWVLRSPDIPFFKGFSTLLQGFQYPSNVYDTDNNSFSNVSYVFITLL